MNVYTTIDVLWHDGEGMLHPLASQFLIRVPAESERGDKHYKAWEKAIDAYLANGSAERIVTDYNEASVDDLANIHYLLDKRLDFNEPEYVIRRYTGMLEQMLDAKTK